MNSVLTFLQKQGVDISAPCGGNGICKKCLVKTSKGEVLACQTPMSDDLDIITTSEHPINAVSTYEPGREFPFSREGKFGIAIDIGTTTLAFELIELTTGRRIHAHTATNSQRRFGTDVISRIKYAAEGGLKEMQTAILQDIETGVRHLKAEVTHIAISGNTTMLHILRGLDCRTLGIFPFKPVDINIYKTKYKSYDIIILPSISTYVGADIVSGLLHLGNKPGNYLLIDLGTNGEIALFSDNKIITAGAAAGPAFEAANISMGMPAIDGAIAKAEYKNDKFLYKTISNKNPIGICGTGVIDIAGEIVKHELCDETGYIEDDINITDNIYFTPKDLREIQLAKSAMRSGIEILLDIAKLDYNQITKIYLAGGFGHKVNPQSAANIGLFPASVLQKIKTVGNTSLAGAISVLLSHEAEEEAVLIAKKAEEVNLASHIKFNEFFMEYMMFGE